MYDLDDVDIKILNILQDDCRATLDEIAQKVGLSRSTVHYRIKRLESLRVIEGCYAKVNPEKVGKEYITITLIRARYGPGYHESVGKKLAELPGVWAVYFVLGETDFVVLTRASSREEFAKVLEQIINMPEIERSSTMVVMRVIKEDSRVKI